MMLCFPDTVDHVRLPSNSDSFDVQVTAYDSQLLLGKLIPTADTKDSKCNSIIIFNKDVSTVASIMWPQKG